MAKKKLTAEQEKEIKLLQANYKMYEQTKEEAKMRGTKESVKRIEIAQEDIKAQLHKLDPAAFEEVESGKEESLDSIESIINNNKKEAIKIQKDLFDTLPEDEEEETVFDIIEKSEKEEQNKTLVEDKKPSATNIPTKDDVVSYGEEKVDVEDTMYNNADESAAYDVIPLPSNGECYKNKLARIPVAYLTAYDENLITSPNLYKDGLVIDFLLKNKIVNKDINPDDLVAGDADAITLFLRATSYGLEFPITVSDPQTGTRIETSIDLSEIKSKQFTLKGDENGWFDFTLPRSKKVIKFKYLTRKEEKQLEKLSHMEDAKVRSTTIKDSIATLKSALQDDDYLDGVTKQKLATNLGEYEKWADEIGNKTEIAYNRLITNRMEFQIQSINGNTDRKFIHKEVMNMLAGDSLALRKYINTNEPGMNFEITVERPESIGGGSFTTFLDWDDSIFLNIA